MNHVIDHILMLVPALSDRNLHTSIKSEGLPKKMLLCIKKNDISSSFSVVLKLLVSVLLFLFYRRIQFLFKYLDVVNHILVVFVS